MSSCRLAGGSIPNPQFPNWGVLTVAQGLSFSGAPPHHHANQPAGVPPTLSPDFVQHACSGRSSIS